MLLLSAKWGVFLTATAVLTARHLSLRRKNNRCGTFRAAPVWSTNGYFEPAKPLDAIIKISDMKFQILIPNPYLCGLKTELNQ